MKNGTGRQKRVRFDFTVEFTNGGSLRGEGFRLDIPGDDISNERLADYLVNDMRLLMVGTIEIRNKRIITEPHKRIATVKDASSAEQQFHADQ